MSNNNTPPKLKLEVGQTVLVGLAFFSICVFWQVYGSIMPLFLRNFDNMTEPLIGLVMSADAILALFMLPLMGRLSDRTKTRFGRRMPYIVFGTALAASTMLLVNAAHNQKNLPFLLVSTVFLLIFMCLYRSPAVSLMPDVTPKSIRSNANAIINLMGAAGGIIALGLLFFINTEQKIIDGVEQFTEYNEPIMVIKDGNWLIFGAVAAIMVIAVIVMIVTINENRMAEKKRLKLESLGINEDLSVAAEAQKTKSTGLSKPELKSFILILASVFLWFFGYKAANVWFSTYAFDQLGGSFALPLTIASITAIAVYYPAFLLGKKFGRRKTILIGIAAVTVGLLIGAMMVLFMTDIAALKIMMYPVFALVGAGWATINVHSYVMAVELAKKGNTGIFTGLYYVFSMGAQAITPVLAGVLYSLSYKTLFFYCAVFLALSGVTMFFVRHGDARKEQAPDNTGDVISTEAEKA